MPLQLLSNYILLNELQPLQRNADDAVDNCAADADADEFDDDDDNNNNDDDDDGEMNDENTVNEGIVWLIWSVLDEFGAFIMIDGIMSVSGG